MRKPAPGTPPRLGLRVVETGTRQAFSPDAVGRIRGQFDATKPFLESFGVEASGVTTVCGWIVLRRDAPARLEVTVNGAPVASETVFAPGGAYRDWPETRESAFETRFDAGPLPRGRGRLALRITGERGTAHEMSIPLRLD